MSAQTPIQSISAEIAINCREMYQSQAYCDVILVPADFDECKKTVGVHHVRFFKSDPINLARRDQAAGAGARRDGAGGDGGGANVARINMDYDYVAIKLAMDLCYGIIDTSTIPATYNGYQIVDAIRIIHYIGVAIDMPRIKGTLGGRINDELWACVDQHIESPLAQHMMDLAECYPVIDEAMQNYVQYNWTAYSKICSAPEGDNEAYTYSEKNPNAEPVFILFGSAEDEARMLAKYLTPAQVAEKRKHNSRTRELIELCRLFIETSSREEVMDRILLMFCRDQSITTNDRISTAWGMILIGGNGRFATQHAYDNYRVAACTAGRFKIPMGMPRYCMLLPGQSGGNRAQINPATDETFLCVAKYVDENLAQAYIRESHIKVVELLASVGITAQLPEVYLGQRVGAPGQPAQTTTSPTAGQPEGSTTRIRPRMPVVSLGGARSTSKAAA